MLARPNEITPFETLRRMTPSAADFTSALSLAANGVSIVTAGSPSGRAGLTVSSMCSVCAEPPIMLACVSGDNEFCVIADQQKHFAINILAIEHQTLSEVFAGLTEDTILDRFTHGLWTILKSGAPVLRDALVSLDCELLSATTHGTHRIYVGRVVELISTPSKPLIYTDRQFADSIPLLKQ